jgi:hypothetical protein
MIQSFQKLSPTFKNERESQLCGANYSNDILILIIWQYVELNKYLLFGELVVLFILEYYSLLIDNLYDYCYINKYNDNRVIWQTLIKQLF